MPGYRLQTTTVAISGGMIVSMNPVGCADPVVAIQTCFYPE